LRNTVIFLLLNHILNSLDSITTRTLFSTKSLTPEFIVLHFNGIALMITLEVNQFRIRYTRSRNNANHTLIRQSSCLKSRTGIHHTKARKVNISSFLTICNDEELVIRSTPVNHLCTRVISTDILTTVSAKLTEMNSNTT